MKEIVFMRDEDALYVVNRKIIGKQGWIEIYNQFRNISLMLCRKNRSGKFSVIGPDINHKQYFDCKSYERPDPAITLTPEQIRQAFAELASVFDDHRKMSKPKISV